MFWEENYRRGDADNNVLMLPGEVYDVFKNSIWFSNETFEQFVLRSSIIMGNEISSKASKCLHYNIIPVSQSAIEYHKYDDEDHKQYGIIQEELWGPISSSKKNDSSNEANGDNEDGEANEASVDEVRHQEGKQTTVPTYLSILGRSLLHSRSRIKKHQLS